MVLICTNSMSDRSSVYQSPLFSVIILANDLSGLAPFEIIRVKEGIDHYDYIHER